MQPELTLHCFPGDISSLAIILLADYLGIDLKLRYLKPVNVAEKFYKSSLTKKFPMLEVKQNESYYLIERSNCIIRFLTDSVNHGHFTDKKQFSYSIGNQNLDYISHDIMPALLTLKALYMRIIEEDKDLEKLLLKDLEQKFGELDLIITNQINVELNHSDFLLYVVLRSACDIPKLHDKLRSSKSFQNRWLKIINDSKFNNLCAPYGPKF